MFTVAKRAESVLRPPSSVADVQTVNMKQHRAVPHDLTYATGLCYENTRLLSFPIFLGLPQLTQCRNDDYISRNYWRKMTCFLLMLLANANNPDVAVCLVLLSMGFDTWNRPLVYFTHPHTMSLSFPICREPPQLQSAANMVILTIVNDSFPAM